MKIITLLATLCVLFSLNASAASLKDKGIYISLSNTWGKPTYREYQSVNKTSEWNYKQKNATLIITKTKCEECKPFTQKDVDEINNYKELATTAMLLNHKNKPALYSIHKNPKEVNFRILKINSNG